MHPQSPDPTPREDDPVLDAAAVAEMERALSALPLHEPSAALDARVAAALADASTASTAEPAPAAIPFPNTAAHRSRWLTGLAAAAVVALLAALGLTIYLQPGGAPSPDGPGVVEVERPDGVAVRVEVGLGGGEDQRRVGDGDELDRDAIFAGEGFHDIEECGHDAPLPLRVQVGFDLIDEEDDLPIWLAPKQLAGVEVLLPEPDQGINQGDDPTHAGRGVDDRDVFAVRHREGWVVFRIVDGDAAHIACAERVRWRW